MTGSLTVPSMSATGEVSFCRYREMSESRAAAYRLIGGEREVENSSQQSLKHNYRNKLLTLDHVRLD